MSAPQSQRWSLRPNLDLDTDNNYFQSHAGDELDSAIQLLNIGLVAAWHTACVLYRARLALFIHGITSFKRTFEVRPAVLVRESSTQLVMYSLDTCVRYSTYIPIFKPQKGSMKALNFLAITS